jgi:hypothetical protein
VSIPTAADYLIDEINTLASSILNKLRIMQRRGTGPSAARDVARMSSDLREPLQTYVNLTMAEADRCHLMTEKSALPPETIRTPRRRNTSRLPSKERHAPRAEGSLSRLERLRAEAWRLDNVHSWRQVCRFPMLARLAIAGSVSRPRIQGRERRHRAENPSLRDRREIRPDIVRRAGAAFRGLDQAGCRGPEARRHHVRRQVLVRHGIGDRVAPMASCH